MPTRLLAFPLVAVTVVAGVWVAGGLITNDFRASVALTTAWLLACAVACLALALRRPRLRIPIVAGYLITAAVVGGYLALGTLRDRVVNERVVVGAPARSAPADAAPSGPSAPADAAPSGPVELARGGFRSGEHRTTGIAAVVRLTDGRRFLTLRNFATSAGPDLRVRLVPGDTLDGGAAGNLDLGALKGNRGNQQYRLPAGAKTAGRTVVIWCRAFSAPFGAARLRFS